MSARTAWKFLESKPPVRCQVFADRLIDLAIEKPNLPVVDYYDYLVQCSLSNVTTVAQLKACFAKQTEYGESYINKRLAEAYGKCLLERPCSCLHCLMLYDQDKSIASPTSPASPAAEQISNEILGWKLLRCKNSCGCLLKARNIFLIEMILAFHQEPLAKEDNFWIKELCAVREFPTLLEKFEELINSRHMYVVIKQQRIDFLNKLIGVCYAKIQDPDLAHCFGTCRLLNADLSLAYAPLKE